MEKKELNKMVLPLTFAVVGFGLLTAAGILAYRSFKDGDERDEDYEGVENYDLAQGKPVIYGLAE